MTPTEERLVDVVRQLIAYARRELPATVREGGLLHELAAALNEHEAARPSAEAAREGDGGPTPGRPARPFGRVRRARW